MHAKVIDMTDGAFENDSANAATWMDPETGLEWQCESPGRMNWHDAHSYAQSLSINGKDGWRLPTARKLETLLDRTVYRPVMREEIPFRDSLSYWSSTTFGPNKNNAWIVMFDGAYVLSYYKTNEYHARCVRE
ncbi:MAG: DUF1566 domain-containing protein [bacterium]|nr:DUF1566 domain-containing protein [bacterium]